MNYGISLPALDGIAQIRRQIVEFVAGLLQPWRYASLQPRVPFPHELGSTTGEATIADIDAYLCEHPNMRVVALNILPRNMDERRGLAWLQERHDVAVTIASPKARINASQGTGLKVTFA